ncbi:hypothetical protein RHVP.49 [Cricetid gammaherpesvirus 2]|uniref:Uncharacterized protein n=1 Tax=Cricetid gammaherpesvirus 2 TaxID=1605972 RepID=E9M5N2_9GAMA|nr:hypothetical protein RHVP.49 [Cricetid gammaherpesvirus 2]ADW24390.1 hypothetical protein RHVP.49 [Cricetid gammaherpesvirus 2]ADW24472.1 hypothetical protein RHVP-L.49 [Cricetid gammaherpesvirus 2]
MEKSFYLPDMDKCLHEMDQLALSAASPDLALVGRVQYAVSVCRTLRLNMDLEPRILPYIKQVILRQLWFLEALYPKGRPRRAIQAGKHSLQHENMDELSLIRDMSMCAVCLAGYERPEVLQCPFIETPPHIWCTNFLIDVSEHTAKKVQSFLDTKDFKTMYSIEACFRFIQNLNLPHSDEAKRKSAVNVLLFWVAVYRAFYSCIHSQYLLDCIISMDGILKLQLSQLINHLVNKHHPIPKACLLHLAHIHKHYDMLSSYFLTCDISSYCKTLQKFLESLP